MCRGEGEESSEGRRRERRRKEDERKGHKPLVLSISESFHCAGTCVCPPHCQRCWYWVSRRGCGEEEVWQLPGSRFITPSSSLPLITQYWTSGCLFVQFTVYAGYLLLCRYAVCVYACESMYVQSRCTVCLYMCVGVEGIMYVFVILLIRS